LNEGATHGENAEGSAAFDSMGARLCGQYRRRSGSGAVWIPFLPWGHPELAKDLARSANAPSRQSDAGL